MPGSADEPLARLWTRGLQRFTRRSHGVVKSSILRCGEAPQHSWLVANRQAQASRVRDKTLLPSYLGNHCHASQFIRYDAQIPAIHGKSANWNLQSPN